VVGNSPKPHGSIAKVLSVIRNSGSPATPPVALILTRQALPTLDRAKYANAIGLARGAYTLAEAPNGNPEVLLLATGSEVALVRRGLRATCPRWNQSSRRQHAVLAAYSKNKIRSTGDSVLPPTVKARVSVEEGSTFGWDPVELSGALRQSTRRRCAKLIIPAVCGSSARTDIPLSRRRQESGMRLPLTSTASYEAHSVGEPDYS
jgi:hypothetical protein